MSRRQLIFHNDEYARIGGSILKAIDHAPEGNNATAEGLYNWLAGPVKDVVQGVMGRKELKSLITLDLSGSSFAKAKWKKLTRNMTHLRIPLPPQNVPSHRATLDRLFWLTVPLPTDLDEETKRKWKVILEDDYRLIQEIPKLVIMDVAKALQWLKGEFDARIVGLRSAARSGKQEGRQAIVSDAVVQSVVQKIVAQADKQADDGADMQMPKEADQPDDKGYVESPSDLTAYISFNDILLDHTADLAKLLVISSLTAKRLRTILKKNPEVKWTRPLSKNTGKPRLNRKLIHLADWRHLVDRLKRGADRELTPAEIKAGAAKVRQERQTR